MTSIPVGWSVAPLREVCRIVSGGTPQTNIGPYWDGDINWVTPNDLSRDRSQDIGGGERTLTRAGYDSCSAQIFPKGSVVVSSRAPIGYVAIAAGDMCTSQGCKTAVPPDILDSKYLYWYLINARSDLEARASGTTFKEISAKTFGDTLLVWPAVDEQRRIVDALEGQLSLLDAARQGCETATARTVVMRRTLWRQAFEGAAESEQWPVVPLLDVVRIANGQTPKGLSERLITAPAGDSVPFFKVGDMKSSNGRDMAATRYFISRSDASSLGLHIRTSGTVLLPKRGGAIATNRKRVLRSEGAYDLNTMGLEPSDRILPDFLWHWLDGIDLSRLADGSNVPQINAPQIRGLALPVPAPARQAEVVAQLDRQYRTVEDLVSGLTAIGRRTDALKAAILTAAFSGLLTKRSGNMDLVEEVPGV